MRSDASTACGVRNRILYLLSSRPHEWRDLQASVSKAQRALLPAALEHLLAFGRIVRDGKRYAKP
jgi:DNA-binding HxlR family transcriptional regulator